jgi:hypothetical protein
MPAININERLPANEPIPFITIPERSTDKVEEFRQGTDRMDKLSLKYYNNPYMGRLILMANPEYAFEFDIEDGALIRIPFPLEDVLEDYNRQITLYQQL